MYETFRNDVLYHLKDLDEKTLRYISETLDHISTGYKIEKAETGLTVIGREQFLKIAGTYIIVRKTEGLKNGTIEHMSRIMKSFIYSMTRPISEIQPNDIRAYLYNYQKERGISNRSLDLIRTIICTFFKWVVSEGYIPTNPAANIRPIKYTRNPRKALSQRELEIIRRSCKTMRDLAIVETLYSTGCRITELCNIKISDIDRNKHEISVLGKGGKYRTVYLNAKSEVAIEVYLSERKHNSIYLFCNDRGGAQMKPANIQRIFSIIENQTNIVVSPHIMRHTMATQALSGGTGIEMVQQMLGHANIATTMVYAEVDQNRVHDAHLKSVI